MIYLSLFFIAFASATLLPLGSEAALLYDLSRLLYSAVMECGNTGQYAWSGGQLLAWS